MNEAWTGDKKKGRRRRQISDRQWHKTVVLLDVSFEDIRAWAQNTFKSRSVQLHTLQRTTSNHSGSARTIHEECDFPCRRQREKGKGRLMLRNTLPYRYASEKKEKINLSLNNLVEATLYLHLNRIDEIISNLIINWVKVKIPHHVSVTQKRLEFKTKIQEKERQNYERL